MRGLLLVSFCASCLAANLFCETGPQELWRSRWGVDRQQCYPTWLAKRPGADSLDTVALCSGTEYLHTSPASQNTTLRDLVLPTEAGYLFQVGVPWGDSDSAFIGGIGVLYLLNLASGQYEWSDEDPSAGGTVSTTCDGQVKFRQDLVYTDQLGLLVVGFCGAQDNLLFVDQVIPETGIVNRSLAIDVSYWEWTGQLRHRAAIDFASGNAYLVAQSEEALHGWVMKLDWSSGIQATNATWNVSIAWHRVGTTAPTIPSAVRIAYLPDPELSDVSVLALLVNDQLLVIPTDQEDELYSLDIPRGVDSEWDLVTVPAECRTSGGPNVVVAHSTVAVHPLQRVFLSFFSVSAGGSSRVYTTEVDTRIDMVLSRVSAAPFEAGCGTGYGVWIAAYSTCDGDNQDACGPGAQPSAEIVAFNASFVNESACSACLTGWADPACGTHCVCVHGDGSEGACYDGPFHNGSCRCNTNTYSEQCLPCTCVNGVCDEGSGGTGFCTQCVPDANGTLYWGANCASPCSCPSDQRCDGGVFGTGRCRKTAPQPSPPSKWKPEDTYLLVGSLVFVALAAPMLYYLFHGHRRADYYPVKADPNVNSASSSAEADVQAATDAG
ncbi:hypothetical protein DIPPA_08977 [Diplonema papillatum]|nr:hypothetical protein DIPPA_08977 [Diplonema papillatum]